MTSHNSSTTPEQMEELLAKHGDTIRSQGLGRADIQRLTGLGESAARRLLALSHGLPTGKRFVSRPAEGDAAPPEPEPAPERQTLRSDLGRETGTVESGKEARLPTPEELLTRAGVDLTVWEIDRAVVTKWDMGSVPRRTGSDQDGWERRSNTPIATELYSVKVFLKRRKDTLSIRQFKEDALAEIRAAAAGRVQQAPTPRVASGASQLLYVGAHDLHVGKFASVHETREGYTSERAVALALASLDRLLEQAAPHGIARIVLPVGHDLAHFESGAGATTAGTPQDTDGRYRLMRRTAYELMVRMIERAAEVAPVDVVGVPGNHGYDTDLGIAERLEARFHSHAHIKVQAPLTPRSYYEYGTTLLGLTHGDRIKHATLPLVMADEMREAWARTTHREWLLGHLHAKQTYQYVQSEAEHRSVRVRVLPSISATDYWHAVCGYANLRAMEAYRYDLADGYVGHHSAAVRPDALA